MEVLGVLCAEDAVFGGEEGGESGRGDGVEDIDGAAAVGVEAGLVGKEADVVEVGEGGEVGGFEDVDAGEGGVLVGGGGWWICG